jgi:uncharacterized protein (DUF1778 family)
MKTKEAKMLDVKERPPKERREANINLRVPPQTRDLIDAAASAIGQTRTEFMVTSARSHAIDVLLDQQFFSLNAEQSKRFVDLLDNPPGPNEKLRALMAQKAPWER